MGKFLGLDLGGTNIKAVVVDDSGGEPRLLTAMTMPTLADRGPDAVIERMVEIGRRAAADSGPVAAAGVGVPGLFDQAGDAVELLPNLPGPWPGHPLRGPMADGLGVPVTVVNDARAFTLAEGRMGAGRGSSTLVGVTLGTGIGGGIMVDGKLHLGAWGIAGEVGHQTVVPDGPRCGCGNRGCVEALAKAESLARLAGRPTAEEVYAGVRAGDERCVEAVTAIAGYLGIALANIVTVLGPDRIVVGGGIAAAGDLLLEPVRDALRTRARLVRADKIEVVPAELGSSAGAIGAALAAAAGV